MAEDDLDTRYPDNPIYVQVVRDLDYDPAITKWTKTGHRPFAELREERLAKREET